MKKVLIGVGVIVILLVGVVLILSNQEVSGETVSKQLHETGAQYIPERNQSNSEVSEADVAWHLYHLIKVINKISDVLISSEPKTYEGSFSFVRTMVFATGTMPRGVGKAPDSVKPPEIILTEDLYGQLEIAKAKLMSLDDLDPNAYYEHPVFGTLDRRQTLLFIEIHTNHHLKIIKDIVAK